MQDATARQLFGVNRTPNWILGYAAVSVEVASGMTATRSLARKGRSEAHHAISEQSVVGRNRYMRGTKYADGGGPTVPGRELVFADQMDRLKSPSAHKGGRRRVSLKLIYSWLVQSPRLHV